MTPVKNKEVQKMFIQQLLPSQSSNGEKQWEFHCVCQKVNWKKVIWSDETSTQALIQSYVNINNMLIVPSGKLSNLEFSYWPLIEYVNVVV